MAMNLRPLHQLLRITTHLLDQAATDVRERELEPALENIERIGRAIIELLEVQRLIQEQQPDLTPKTLAATPPEADANRVFTRFMIDALQLEDAGKPAAAAEKYASFINISRSFTHREIARAQIRRLS